MKHASERLNRVIELQRRAFFVNVILSAFLTVVSALALAIESFFLAFLAGIFFMWLFMKLLNTVTLMFIQMKVYQGDTEALVQDAQAAVNAINNPPPPQPEVRQLMMKVIDIPENPIGKYMDTDIFEWMDIQDPEGVTQRFEFTGTVNLEKGETPPQGTLTFPPGIIYEPKKSG
jgi:hypothetical protein